MTEVKTKFHPLVELGLRVGVPFKIINKDERIYCRICGTKLKRDFIGLKCPENYTHKND